MGMDLKPQRPHKDAPKWEDGKVKRGRYNNSGWCHFANWLEEKGVDISSFPFTNDGYKISAAKCKEVASVIEKHKSEYPWQADVDEDLILWQTCGGYRVY